VIRREYQDNEYGSGLLELKINGIPRRIRNRQLPFGRYAQLVNHRTLPSLFFDLSYIKSCLVG
jgi:hypothetical protein